MPYQLTPGEYDDLPPDVKAELLGVVRQPNRDKKSKGFRRRFGRYANGELDADPIVQSITGYGTGSPLAPQVPAGPLPPPQIPTG